MTLFLHALNAGSTFVVEGIHTAELLVNQFDKTAKKSLKYVLGVSLGYICHKVIRATAEILALFFATNGTGLPLIGTCSLFRCFWLLTPWIKWALDPAFGLSQFHSELWKRSLAHMTNVSVAVSVHLAFVASYDVGFGLVTGDPLCLVRGFGFSFVSAASWVCAHIIRQIR